jgi:histidinol-phosphate/aromatic aminotransferase/cobyric acid decarboxylase-like protein
LRPPFESSVFAEAAALQVAQVGAHLVPDLADVVDRGDRTQRRRLAEIGGTVTPSRTLFANWRHPEAARIWSGLRRRKIFCLGAGNGVVHGMPEDMLRLTARRPEVVDQVVEKIRTIL